MKCVRKGTLAVLLAILSLALIGTGLFFPSRSFAPKGEEVETLHRDTAWTSRVTARHRHYAVPERMVETFPFDPNTADSTTLLRLGFPPYMVRSIYRYRARGGRYHVPEDLTRLYGMTGELWHRISPYIRIAEKYQYMQTKESFRRENSASQDSAQLVFRPHKMKAGEKLGINSSDTTQLQEIPGIGPYYARVIARYRERLGGFVSLSQLSEVEGLPEDIASWFVLDEVQVRQLDVNRATRGELLRHPYIHVPHVQSILNYRRKQGLIRNLQEMGSLPDFSPADVQRLSPYVCF